MLSGEVTVAVSLNRKGLTFLSTANVFAFCSVLNTSFFASLTTLALL
ncbi:hypothetical protein P788_1965 [Enterococcus faecalis MTUP9]|nr:hypothetical protein P788_1965 [Enterococcus faecalis MTUP9]